MIRPPSLHPGDKVAIVSTARKITRAEIEPAVTQIKAWGLEVILGSTIGKSAQQFAGSDAERIKDLQTMLDDPQIRAIFCARGGYGTVRLLDAIDFSPFMQQPKWIVGYSDVTALMSHLQTVCQLETIHGTMPVNFPTNSEGCLNALRNALFGERVKYSFESHPMNRPGVCSGRVLGGNLSVLYSLAGSRSLRIPPGSILFLEDLDEYLYHIDRMMMNLKRGGHLQELAGLIVGGMTDMHDNEVPFGKKAEEIIADILSNEEVPVGFGFPAGHLDHNMPLILGRQARITIAPTACEIDFEV